MPNLLCLIAELFPQQVFYEVRNNLCPKEITKNIKQGIKIFLIFVVYFLLTNKTNLNRINVNN